MNKPREPEPILTATVRDGKIICDLCDMTVSSNSWRLMDVHMETHQSYPKPKNVSGGR